MGITKEQVEFYRENGFIKLENIFSTTELEEICQEYDELFIRKQNCQLEATWKGELMNQAAQNEKVSVLSIHNLQFHSAVFTRILMNKSLLDALEQIMDTPNILLHHTKAHFKPPSQGAPFLVHQDYHYFPYKKHSPVAVFLHLDDSTPDNGGLAVYPGSHKLGPLEDVGTQGYHYVNPDKYPISGATPVEAKKGDIVIFSYLLLHGSFLNKSQRPRRMFLIQAILGWLQETEVQAVLLGTALVVVVYVLTSWVLYSIFCVIWPLTILAMLVMVLLPNTAGSLILDAIPPGLAFVTQWLLNLIHAGNVVLQPAVARRPTHQNY